MAHRLPRRYFNTQSTNTSTDILRTRDSFKTKAIDSNDIAGASAVKEIVIKQDDISGNQESILSRLDTLESTTISDNFSDYKTAFDNANS